jgi:glycosyltransferase involved in cell wall biosynthesis
MTSKVCILSEGLGGTRDEGMRNFVASLSDALGRRVHVDTLSLDTGVGTPGEIRTNRLLLSGTLKRELASRNPDVILYVPLASSTTGSYIRSWVLRRLCPRAHVVMVALQPRRHGTGSRTLMRWFRPDGLLVQHSGPESDHPGFVPTGTLPSGVDTSRFKPLPPKERREVRKSLGFGNSEFVVLHVGHIRRQRNVGVLESLCREIPCRAVLVGSTSTEQDDLLACELERHGVRVIRERVPEIEQIYQASDAYLFPVSSDQAAIEMPLSVLEAMACNLPVLSTRFGALPKHFPEGRGIWYFDNEDEIPDLLGKAMEGSEVFTREQVLPFGWDEVAATLQRTLEGWGMLPGGGGP